MDQEPSNPESTCITVTAAGSDDVHLALHEGAEAGPRATLCDRPVEAPRPTRHFQEAGCCACARVSLERGIDCALENTQVVVNLRRFYDRASRSGPTAGGLVDRRLVDGLADGLGPAAAPA